MIDTQTKTEQAQGAETVNAIFADFRNQTETSFPSLFSREDVLLLLEQIQAQVSQVATGSSSSGSDDVQLKAFADKIRAAVISAVEDHDYDDNMEVDLDGREIRVDFDYRYLSCDVAAAIDNAVEEEFETEEND